MIMVAFPVCYETHGHLTHAVYSPLQKLFLFVWSPKYFSCLKQITTTKTILL